MRQVIAFLRHKVVFKPGVRYAGLIVLLLLTGQAMLNRYHKIVSLPPSGIHLWRQTDGTSMALTMYNENRSITEPGFHNMHGGGNGGAEFPILYYASAKIMTITGPGHAVLRIITLAFTGLFLASVWFLSRKFIDDPFYAALIPILLFSSIIFNYYGFSYLPEIPSIAMAMAGWLAYFSYRKNKSARLLLLFFFCFTLSVLLKASSFYHLASLAVLYLYDWYHQRRQKSLKAREMIYILSGFSISAALILSWYLYIISYNAEHGSYYFLTGIVPVWNYNPAEIKAIFHLILERWPGQLYALPLFLLIPFALAFTVLYRKSADSFLWLWVLLLTVGGLLYFMLFFQRFQDHDYYFIILMPVPVAWLILFMQILEKRFPVWSKSLLFRSALVLITAFAVYKGMWGYEHRYAPDGFLYESVHPSMHTLGAELDKFIDKEAKIISLPDPSPNTTLYFLDRRGWTGLYHESGYTPGEISAFIYEGAEYLVITDPSIAEKDEWQPFIGEKVLEHEGAQVYALHP